MQLFLGYYLPFYLPNSPKNQNFLKMKISSGDIIILHLCIKNYIQSNDVRFLRFGARQMDGQTDRKSDIQRWLPHLKIQNPNIPVKRMVKKTLVSPNKVLHKKGARTTSYMHRTRTTKIN